MPHAVFPAPRKDVPYMEDRRFVTSVENISSKTVNDSGDTQPMSPDAIEQFIEQNRSEIQPQSDLIESAAVSATSDGADRTLKEGDTGFLRFTESHPPRDVSCPDQVPLEEIDIDEVSSPAYYQHEAFPESQRFKDAGLTPMRPPNSLSQRTPSVPQNPFAGAVKTPGAVMPLSQVFATTQSPASSNILKSDLPESIPSPNIPIENQPITENLSYLPDISASSSSIKPVYADPPPKYIPMKTSQDRRELLRFGNKREVNSSSDDESGDDSVCRRHRHLKEIDSATSKQFKTITATRSESKRCSKESYSGSPLTHTRDSKSLFPLLDTGKEQNDTILHVGSEEETEREDKPTLPKQHQSTRPFASNDDDKENIQNDAISTHNAISEVLTIEASPATHGPNLISGPNIEQTKSQYIYPESCNIPSTSQSTKFIRIMDSQPGDQDKTSGSPFFRPSSPRGNGSDTEAVPNSLPISQRMQSSASPCINEEIASESNLHGAKELHKHTSYTTPSHEIRKSRRPVELSNVVALSPGKDNQLNPLFPPETPANASQNQGVPYAIPATSPYGLPTTTMVKSKRVMDFLPSSQGQTSDSYDHNLPQPRFPAQSRHKLTNNLCQENGEDERIGPSHRFRRLTEIASEQSPNQSRHSDFVKDIDVWDSNMENFYDIHVQLGSAPSRKSLLANSPKNLSLFPPSSFVSSYSDTNSSLHQSDAETNRVEAELSDQSDSEVEAPRPATMQHQKTSSRKRSVDIWDIDQSFRQPAKKIARSRQIQPLARPSSLEHDHSLTTKLNYKPSVKAQRPATPSISRLIQQRTQRQEARRKSLAEMPTRQDSALEPKEIKSPNQVFAFWNGKPAAFYPATCIGTLTKSGSLRYVVRFEDDRQSDVDETAIKRLELRVDDIVKVDLIDVPNGHYVVTGFQNLDDESMISDIYGRRAVTVSHKSKDIAFSGTIPIRDIHLDKILWKRLTDRAFSFNASSTEFQIRPNSATPTKIRSSSPILSSRHSFQVPRSDCLFSGMAFAVSLKDNDYAKSQIEKVIFDHGGRIIFDDFKELFCVPGFLSEDGLSSSQVTIEQEPLQLSPDAENIGFVCVISDGSSRRVKYLQALALNIPCIATRWVQDCLHKKTILDWTMYLLPAGESLFLGMTKSRTLRPSSSLQTPFSQTVAQRTRMLAGQSVLMVMGRGKGAIQRRQVGFLTYALGPDMIGHTSDMHSAIRFLENEKTLNWDWLYVSDEKGASSARVLLGTETSSKLSKHKPRSRRSRGRKSAMSFIGSESCDSPEVKLANGRKIRLLDNEFICQSLILGNLLPC